MLSIWLVSNTDRSSALARVVLDRNPENYFAEVEQAAFEPKNIVQGMGYSPDKMLQARLISYPDAHRYRLGVSYEADLLRTTSPIVSMDPKRIPSIASARGRSRDPSTVSIITWAMTTTRSLEISSG